MNPSVAGGRFHLWMILFSLCLALSDFLHLVGPIPVASDGFISFLPMAERHLLVTGHCISWMWSSVGDIMVDSQLASLKRAAGTIGVHVSFAAEVSPSIHIVGRSVCQRLPWVIWVLGLSMLFPTMADSSYPPEGVLGAFPLFYSSPTWNVCRVFDVGRLDWQQVIPPWNILLHSWRDKCWALATLLPCDFIFFLLYLQWVKFPGWKALPESLSLLEFVVGIQYKCHAWGLVSFTTP